MKLNFVEAGDCRTLAKQIPDGSAQITFTSPPYNVGLNYGVWNDSMPVDEFWAFQREWLTDAFRITTGPGRLYAIISEDMLWPFRDLAQEIGWKYHQLLAWCKPNFASPGRVSKDWNAMTEWCLLFHKGKRTPMLNIVPDISTHNFVIEASPQSQNNGLKKKVHPAQMAIKVAYKWLGRTPGQVVYEPFAGSGSTCVAARMLGKDFIAFEIDPPTADLANKQVVKAPLPQLAFTLPSNERLERTAQAGFLLE